MAGDVTSVFVDVQDATPTSVGSLALTETPIGSDIWLGTITLLPLNEPLNFIVTANNLGVPVFAGQTTVTLTVISTTVSLNLGHVGTDIQVPSILSISVKDPVGNLESVPVVVEVQGQSGETLTAVLTSPALTGAFDDGGGVTTGISVTLDGSGLGTLTLRYIALDVSTPTTETHTLRLTTVDGFFIQVNVVFNSAPTSGSAEMAIFFNPIIQGIDIEQVGADVKLNATVVDENDLEAALTYLWEIFTGPSFNATSALNPATLSGYNPSFEGIFVLTVTDTDGGATTIGVPLDQTAFLPFLIGFPLATGDLAEFGFNTFTVLDGWTADAAVGGVGWVQSSVKTADTSAFSMHFGNTGGTSYSGGTGGALTLDAPVNLGGKPAVAFQYFLQTECGIDNFCLEDSLTLEVSTDGGTAWSQVAMMRDTDPATPSGGWVLRIVDLTGYANQAVKLRFNFTQNGTNDAFIGAYVDEVFIIPTLFSFDRGFAEAWTASGAWALSTARNDTPSWSFFYGDSAGPNYQAAALTGELISPPFTLPDYGSFNFSYFLDLGGDTAGDKFEGYISVDGGAWILLGGGALGETAFQFGFASANVQPWAGKSAQFKFVFTHDGNVTAGEGAYIDSVHLIGFPAPAAEGATGAGLQIDFGTFSGTQFFDDRQVDGGSSYYKFTAGAGGTAVISINNMGADLDLTLYSDDTFLLGVTCDLGDNTGNTVDGNGIPVDESCSFTAAISDTYYIKVSGTKTAAAAKPGAYFNMEIIAP